MDDARFDDLARLLNAPSRRSVLIGAAALALFVGRPIQPETLARKRKKHKKKRKRRKPTDTGCQSGTRPCGDKCLTPDQCCDSTDCDPGQSCNAANTCFCQAQCGDAECGDDGCGGSCGACGAGEHCQDGQCICDPDCAGKACGDDGCGGSCGACHATQEICEQGQCACSVPGKLGPGEICSSDTDCCPYSGDEICSKGAGFCETFMPVCRSGLGGKCGGNCDCRGDLECRDGVCQCPPGRAYLDDGVCCAQGLSPCGGVRCCEAFESCLCPPGGSCRCF